MKDTLLAASVAAMAAAGGLVAWSVLARPSPSYVSAAASSGFNMTTGSAAPVFEPRPAAVPAPSLAPRVPDELRDAVASPMSPKPIPLDGMSGGPSAPSAPMSPSASETPAAEDEPGISPKAKRWALGHRLLRTLLRAPASVLLSQGALRSPRALRGFLDDKKAVDGYLNSGLVRAALKSPEVSKKLLTNPVLIAAVVSTPAMRDESAVRALLGSRMLRKMLDCPGIQEALSDPEVHAAIAGDPRTIEWISQNPQSLRVLADAAPALAGSLRALAR